MTNRTGIDSMVLNHQWSSRPNDQRFLTVADLAAKVRARRQASTIADVALDAMLLRTSDDGEEVAITDGRVGGIAGVLNHWSFGQLCARAGSPAGYLRRHPAMMAATMLQWDMEKRETSNAEGNDAKLMIFKDQGVSQILCATSPTYGRIWDEDVCNAIEQNVDLDLWKVPSSSYSAKDPLRATTLYASDRDCFLFLVNEQSSIDVAGESLKRGFYVWNSEVGSSIFGIATFTYDFVCDNRIIWGQRNFAELRIRHTSGGPHRFVAQAAPQLAAYAQSSTANAAATIKVAKAKEVGKDRKSVIEWMKSRGFTVPVAGKAYDAAERDTRSYNPRSVWGLVQGVTDVAHDMRNTDSRTDMERKAGALLDDLAEAA